MKQQEETETIYRMETADHHGPFSPEACDGKQANAEKMWRNVPWIKCEPLGLRSQDYSHPHHLVDCMGMPNDLAEFCDCTGTPVLRGDWLVGCKSWDQFYHWFPKACLADMAAAGMRIDVYKCPKAAVIDGHYQSMFNESKAKLVQTIHIGEGARIDA